MDTVWGAQDAGVSWLTVYAFSTENWRRPLDEVRFLMNFNERLLVNRRDELNEKNIRVRFMGRRDWRVPRRLLRRMDETVSLTSANTSMTLTIAFNYGGRAELVDGLVRTLPKRLRRHARTGIGDPDVRRDPNLELPHVGIGLLGMGLHRRVVARFSSDPPV